MTARGIRNNNPLNIDRGAQVFQGAAATQPDPRFWTFIGPEWGIRAAARILLTYETHGVDTLKEIISRWAPPAENDTPAYIAAVAHDAAIADVDQVLDLTRAPLMMDLLKAMVRHENGLQPYPDEIYAKAVQLAGLVLPRAAA